MLYLVGTPIGNIGDLSPRAAEVLSEVDLIACEDTRRTGMLLKSFDIENKLFSYHEHNKAAKGPVLVSMLKEGKNIALVTDAGMPCISDPGYDLVKLCELENLDVTAVPGPVAAVTALALSGISTRRYHFEGFIPSEGKERKERISALRDVNVTIVLYEAPHRLQKTVSELCEAGFGSCRAAFCRELTKKYEQIVRMTLNEAVKYYEETPPKGEYVICMDPIPAEDKNEVSSDFDLDAEIKRLSNEGMSTKEIASNLSQSLHKSKKELYNYILNLLK